MSVDLSFIVARLTIRKTIKYINQSDNSSQWVFSFNTLRFGYSSSLIGWLKIWILI
jgi:cell division inhibitor SulA